MRSSLPAVALVLASITSLTSAAELPAWAPASSESAPLSFISGTSASSYELSLALPALTGWDSLTIDVYLSGDVFGPLTAASFSTPYSVFGGVGVGDHGASSKYSDANRPGEALHHYQVLMVLNQMEDIAAGTSVLTMALPVQPNLVAPALGSRQIFTDLEYTTFYDDDPFNASLTIHASVAAVPEPQTWAALAAGLALIAPIVGCRRRKAALDAV